MSKSAPDPVYVLRGSDSPISYLKFVNSENLLSGSYNGNIFTWSMETKRIIHKMTAHPDTSVLYIGLVDDSHVISQGRNGFIKYWSITESNWTEMGIMKCLEMGFCRCCLLDERTLVAPSDNQSEVVLYDLNSNNVTCQLRPDSSVYKVGMCMNIKSGDEDGNNRRLLIGYEDGSVLLWDVRNRKIVDRLKIHDESLMCLDYSTNLNKGYSGSVNEVVKSWTISNDKINESKAVTVTNCGFNDALIRPDGKIVVFAGWDEKIRVFGTKKLKPLAVLNYHKASIHCLTFSESNMLACGSKDHQISLWDIYR